MLVALIFGMWRVQASHQFRLKRLRISIPFAVSKLDRNAFSEIQKRSAQLGISDAASHIDSSVAAAV